MAARRVRLELRPPAEIRALVYRDNVGPFMGETTLKVINRARVLTPVDKGLLRSSHTMSVKLKGAGNTAAVGRIETPVKYAEFVHNPTRPHIIRAKNAKALAFMWKKAGGRVIVPKAKGATYRLKNGVLVIGKGYVNHPGTKGRPFYTQALREICEPLGFVVTTTHLGADSASGDTSAFA